MLGIRDIAISLGLGMALAASPISLDVSAQSRVQNAGKMVQLDFNDVELSVVIDTVAKITGRNFIYDDRVRGRVTIVSPTQITIEQAFAVFESVLQVKGFTTVEGPGGVLKIIPVRDAKSSSIETVVDDRPSPNRDTFVTRLIPLRYIDAEAITNTVKPLVSKDAAMVAYPPTNTIILTDTAANIRRLMGILDAIDIETYKEDLAVIKIKHADASTLGQQISEIYGTQVASSGTSAAARRVRSARRASSRTTEATVTAAKRGQTRIITDERTNSLIVLASRSQLEEIRGLVRKLDVPVTGGGSIRVYYLKHADAEELAQTLNGLVSGQPTRAPRTGAAGGAAQALRAAVTELAGGVSLTADPATNSLIIQASKEAYETLAEVIGKLDIARPQVLVEALIMEVLVKDEADLGFNALLTLTRGWDIALTAASDSVTSESLGNAAALAGTATPLAAAGPFAANVVRRTQGGNVIQGILRAAAKDGNTNVISAPHILTSDNEEAEIRIGNNIPIITSRVDAATGVSDRLSSSVNVERQDIGVTLRVTPQISEGDSVR
ncbi:MAG: type II secretion system secretin GspD, partial [Myxococcota bacterium]